jgi:predicted phage tail protein
MALNSKTTIKLIDLICEGPIEGIQGRKGVYLNETAAVDKNVQREDFEQRRGHLGQDLFEGERAVVIPQPVNLRVGDNYSEKINSDGERVDGSDDYGEGKVIQTLTDLEADSVELIFTVPRLYSTAVEGLARGQLFPAKIKLQVDIQCSSGPYVTVYSKVVEGISTSGYQFRTPKIELDFYRGAPGPWNIRVRKRTFDPREDAFEIKRTDLVDLPQETTPLQDGRGDVLEWSQIIIYKRGNVNYAGTACAALSLDSEQFQSLPSRAYDVKGLKVQIPSNATPRKDGSLEFSSLPFDGRLKTEPQWTTCPVCCFYDMLINSRYGAGDFIDADNISWIDLIGIAKYCNKLIDVGNGKKEPRFAINTVIGSQADAYSVIQDLASVFRGMVFWKSDTIQLAADHGNLDGSDLDPIHVFTNSNVVGGGFVYNGSSLKTRSTRVVARYSDPDNFYKPNYIIVEDKDAISKYGLQTREIVAFGCTSKTQAQRMAKWVMTSEEIEGETITFSVGLEGLNVLPGQIFAVSDAMRQGARLAGRIVGADKTKIIADQNVSSPPGSNDQLTVVLPDGRVQARAATLDGTSTILVSPDFDEPPADDAVWTITDTSVANQKFRCLSVAEGEDGTYSIVGVQHVDNIYDVVEGRDSDLDFPDTTLFDDRPAQPEDLQILFFDITQSRNRFRQINVSWSRGTDLRAVRFQVDYKITDAGNFKSIFTTNTNVDIDDSILANQKVVVRVYAIGPEPNALRSLPTKSEAIANPDNVTSIPGGGTVQNRPPDAENVTLEPVGKDQVVMRWAATANGQSLDEFVAVIRHSGKTDGSAEWYQAILLRRVEARTTYATLPLMEGEYFVKFENNQKVRSLNAVSAVIDLPDQLPLFNYESIQLGANNFPGIRDGVYYDDDFDGLVLDGDASFDDEVTDLDALTENIDSIFGTQRTSGTYYFGLDFDFGAKYSPLFKRILDSVGVYRTDTFDDRLDLIDTWADFDGDIADDVNVEVYLRAGLDDEGNITGNDFDAEDAVQAEDGTLLLLETGDTLLNDSNIEYGPWVPLENTNFVGRYFQFKAVLTTDHVDQTPSVESLGVDVKFETRTENSKILVSDLGAPTAVTFDYPFYTDSDTKASVGIIAYDMEPGDYFILGEPDSQGFTIDFKGSFDGTERISRRFRYTAVGYGAKQP